MLAITRCLFIVIKIAKPSQQCADSAWWTILFIDNQFGTVNFASAFIPDSHEINPVLQIA